MLRLHEGERYPGAIWTGSDPVTEAECCLAQSVALLAAASVAAGAAYSIAGGEIFSEISSGDLMTACQGDAPVITAIATSDLADFVANSFTGTDFGAVEGEVWVGNTANFAASTTLVQQTVDVWTDTQVDFTAIQGAFGLSPPPAFLFVLNVCGRPNLVGEQVNWVE